MGLYYDQFADGVIVKPGVDTALGNGELGVEKYENGEYEILKFRIWELKIPVNWEIVVFRTVNWE